MPWRGPDEFRSFPSLGDQVVQWIEAHLCHGPGDVLGEPIELDDEFYEFVIRAYALDPDTGQRVYRRAFLSRPKGRAKSELAGMLVCAEALGPVRFAGWDATGDPVGKPVTSPYIRCLATEEGQSGNTYDNVTVMLAHLREHHGDEYPGIDLGRSAQSSSRIYLPGHGEVVPSTASGASKDGGKETFAVFDETHLYVLPELRRMHEVVRRNLRKRRNAEPWCLETSTMYRPGEESVAEGTHNYATAIAEGRVREPGLLFDHRQAPTDTDLASRDSLLAGLRAAYGPAAAWLDLDGIVAEIWDPQSDPADSRRYWLNQPAVAEDALVTAAEWDACHAVGELLDPKDEITLGFDGSKSDDSTVLVAMRVRDRFATVIGAMEKDPHDPYWEVDRTYFDGLVANIFATYRVVGFYADVSQFETNVDQWSAEYGRSLLVQASPRSACGWDMRGRLQVLTQATERLVAGIRDRDVHHDGGTLLRRHVLNARRRPNRWGISFGKDRKGSPRKVDAFAALQLADMARADRIAAGGKVRVRSGRVW